MLTLQDWRWRLTHQLHKCDLKTLKMFLVLCLLCYEAIGGRDFKFAIFDMFWPQWLFPGLLWNIGIRENSNPWLQIWKIFELELWTNKIAKYWKKWIMSVMNQSWTPDSQASLLFLKYQQCSLQNMVKLPRKERQRKGKDVEMFRPLQLRLSALELPLLNKHMVSTYLPV